MQAHTMIDAQRRPRMERRTDNLVGGAPAWHHCAGAALEAMRLGGPPHRPRP